MGFYSANRLIQFILAPIAEFIFLIIGYPSGWFLVTIVTLGEIEAGPFDRVTDYTFYHSKRMKWWHFTYLDNGSRFLPAESVAGIAWIFVLGVSTLIAALIFYIV